MQVLTRRLFTSLLFTSVLFFGMLAPRTGTAIQTQQRIVRHPVGTIPEPVRISRVRTKAGEFKRDKKFMADDDWYKGFVVSVTNTSGKNITHVDVSLRFLRPEDDETSDDPSFVEHLSYGPSPILPKSEIMKHPPKLIMPGETIELVLTDEAFESIKRILKRFKYPDSVKTIELMLVDVGFDDDTRWSGQMFRRDPDNPDKWIPMDEPQGSNLKGSTSNGAASFLGAKFKNLDAILFPVSFYAGETFLFPSRIKPLPRRGVSHCGSANEAFFNPCISDQAGCHILKQTVNKSSSLKDFQEETLTAATLFSTRSGSGRTPITTASARRANCIFRQNRASTPWRSTTSCRSV